MRTLLSLSKSLSPTKILTSGALAQKVMCLLLVPSLLLIGCGGKTANPVDRYMLGDEDKSCDALYAEVSNIDDEIALKSREKGSKDLGNILLGVLGFFLIVPLFFIDTKASQETERDALRARKKQLMILFADKNCSAPSGVDEEEKGK